MNMSRNHTWLLLPVLILVAGSVFAKQFDVTECGTVIDKPVKYRVMNDILDCTPWEDGVVILTSDVTLDLRGHTISCARDPSVAPVGNLITDGFFGIMLYGVEESAVPPDDPVIWPVASGNLVKHNMALGNFMGLQETTYVVAVDDAYVAPGATCQNTWMSNQFGSELGPSDCIGISVELDEDDVCALDDD